jgi:hypothetical protein
LSADPQGARRTTVTKDRQAELSSAGRQLTQSETNELAALPAEITQLEAKQQDKKSEKDKLTKDLQDLASELKLISQ